MTNKKCVLLLTACIAPDAVTVKEHAVQRSDPVVRLNDYKIALKYWLNYKDDRIEGIVFVENSLYSLDELQQIAVEFNSYRRSIEFFKCKPQDIPENVHYGYSELQMIDEAFDRSMLIKEADYVAKVTGRLYFPALTKLLDWISENHLFVADCRDFKFGKVEKHYVLTTLFLARQDFYRQVLHNAKAKMVMPGNGLMETLYFRILKPLSVERAGSVLLRFPFNVDPVGIGAHWGKSYTSFRNRSIATVRAGCRRCFPALKI